MKITQEHVGKKVRPKYWSTEESLLYVEVLLVGKERFFSRDNEGHEMSWPLTYNWELYEEPKKKRKILSPVVSKVVSSFYISDTLYETEEMARQARGEYFHSWPAMQIIDGKEVPIRIVVEE